MPFPPLPNSYWVLPGRLLAGEHPWGGDPAATERRLDLLLAAGLRSFIDLTQPEELPGYSHLLPKQASYSNLPIRDHSVPAKPAQMREIQQVLAAAIDGQGGAYVHCRAGIGRTGITIGCFLRESGRSPQAALDELNRLWRQNARSARWPSVPETEEQEEYIHHWKPQVRHGTGT